MKEKHLVDHICSNWKALMLNSFNLHFGYREKQWRSRWRCDLTAYTHIEKDGRLYKRPVFIEVKHKRNTRDLLYEVHKALDAASIHEVATNVRPIVAVIVDTLEPHVLNELMNLGVVIYRYRLFHPHSNYDMFDGMKIYHCETIEEFHANFILTN